MSLEVCEELAKRPGAVIVSNEFLGNRRQRQNRTDEVAIGEKQTERWPLGWRLAILLVFSILSWAALIGIVSTIGTAFGVL